MCLNRGRVAGRLVVSKTITDHRHLFRALDAPGPEGCPAGRARTMSTTARQGDSSTPMPHAGAGGAEQISAEAVMEAVNDLHDRFCTDLLSTAGSGMRHWGR